MASGASRDVGLERIGRSTRFLAVGAILAGGVLSAAAAKALPGKSIHHATSTNTATPSQAAPSDNGGQTAATPGLSPPAQAPQPVVTAPPVVSSGGS